VSTWQEESQLHNAAKVCYGRLLLPLSAEFEGIQNLGDFWMALLYILQGGARYRTMFFFGENEEFEFR